MPRTAPLADHDGDPAMEDGGPEEAALDVTARFWRNRFFARMRHRLTGLRGLSTLTTRMHAKLIRLSGDACAARSCSPEGCRSWS